MTTPTRPFDAGSVIDQILTGHLNSASTPTARPGLSTSESAFVDAVSDWCARQDLAADIEANGQVPDKVLAELVELGALRIIIPQRYGGLGFSDTCLLSVLSVLTTAHASLCEIVAAHQVIGAVRPLTEFGTEHQRTRYLPELLKLSRVK
ncbi:acyl-CoA dehydrogenase family protein [Micrococcus luteus KDCGSN]|uniref:acyl-CoA dehydrogenase family protein n=1 Tax=Micrococcus luteus TaxID=1270 RepID=UPI003EEC463B